MKEKTVTNRYSRTFRIELPVLAHASFRLLAAAVVLSVWGSPESLLSADAQVSSSGATASTAADPSASRSRISAASSAVSDYFKKRPVRSGMTDLKSRIDRWEKNFRSRQEPSQPQSQAVAAPTAHVAPSSKQPSGGEASAKTGWNWKPKMPDLKAAATQSAIHTADNAQSRGDLDTAVRWYQRALKFDPTSQEAQTKLNAAKALKQKVMNAVSPTAPKKGWFGRL